MFLTAVAAQSCGGGNVFIDWGIGKDKEDEPHGQSPSSNLQSCKNTYIEKTIPSLVVALWNQRLFSNVAPMIVNSLYKVSMLDILSGL